MLGLQVVAHGFSMGSPVASATRSGVLFVFLILWRRIWPSDDGGVHSRLRCHVSVNLVIWFDFFASVGGELWHSGGIAEVTD